MDYRTHLGISLGLLLVLAFSRSTAKQLEVESDILDAVRFTEWTKSLHRVRHGHDAAGDRRHVAEPKKNVVTHNDPILTGLMSVSEEKHDDKSSQKIDSAVDKEGSISSYTLSKQSNQQPKAHGLFFDKSPKNERKSVVNVVFGVFVAFGVVGALCAAVVLFIKRGKRPSDLGDKLKKRGLVFQVPLNHSQNSLDKVTSPINLFYQGSYGELSRAMEAIPPEGDKRIYGDNTPTVIHDDNPLLYSSSFNLDSAGLELGTNLRQSPSYDSYTTEMTSPPATPDDIDNDFEVDIVDSGLDSKSGSDVDINFDLWRSCGHLTPIARELLDEKDLYSPSESEASLEFCDVRSVTSEPGTRTVDLSDGSKCKYYGEL